MPRKVARYQVNLEKIQYDTIMKAIIKSTADTNDVEEIKRLINVLRFLEKEVERSKK